MWSVCNTETVYLKLKPDLENLITVVCLLAMVTHGVQ